MATTSPARIDDDLYASAKLAGEVQSRSASQQVVHWARIGREIEASASISQKDIAEALSGSRSYDSLTAKEQAVVRAEWSARMDVRREALNLAEEYAAAGRTWVELDDEGNVVERGAVARRGGSGERTQARRQQGEGGRDGRARNRAKTARGKVAKGEQPTSRDGTGGTDRRAGGASGS